MPVGFEILSAEPLMILVGYISLISSDPSYRKFFLMRQKWSECSALCAWSVGVINKSSFNHIGELEVLKAEAPWKSYAPAKVASKEGLDDATWCATWLSKSPHSKLSSAGAAGVDSLQLISMALDIYPPSILSDLFRDQLLRWHLWKSVIPKPGV